MSEGADKVMRQRRSIVLDSGTVSKIVRKRCGRREPERVQMCDMEGYLGSCGEAGVLGLRSGIDLHTT